MQQALLILTVLLAVFSIGFAEQPAAGADFYVATSGNDGSAGTKEKPFATLTRAQEAVRQRVVAGLGADVTVLIRGGTYALAEPLTYGPDDSGTAAHSITYAAYPKETVIVSGGAKIAGWKKGEGEVWTARMPGVAEGTWYFRQLYVNGQRASRARTPNGDADQPCWQLKGASLSDDLKTHTYQFEPAQVKQWRNLTDVECVVFGNWATTRKRFETIDPATGTAEMAGPHAKPHDAMAPAAGRWFYIENAFEELDQPGEWYLDRQTGTLSYWPRAGEDLTTAEVVAPRLTRLLEVTGTAERPVRNLHFRGLRFEHADWTPPQGGYLGIQACHFATGTAWSGNPWGRIDAAISWNWADSCSFEDGAVAHLGGCGIELVAGCSNDTVEGNEVFDISGNGTMLGGPSDEAEVPKHCRLANNHVHACGLDYHGAVGMWTGFAQQAVIAHNLVHDLPYSGISLGWQWNPEPTAARENTVEYNHISDVMKRLGDGGGIYTLGFQPGTVLRGNHIHDVARSGYAQAAPNNGMFIDEGSRGFLFEGNVIYRTSAEPVRFNQCGRDWHEWKDNHFGGVFPAPGRLGSGLACDGSSAHLEVPNAPELEPEQLTVEAWIQLPEFPAGGDARKWIVNKNRNEWEQGHYGLVLDEDRAGAYLNIGGGQDNSYSAWAPEGQLTPNDWHHLAMTYDGATLRVYLDGNEVGSEAINKPRVPGSTPLDIGRRQDGYTYFKGVIDEVRVYSRALSTDDLKARFAQPVTLTDPKAESGLSGYWNFDDLSDETKALQELAAKAGLEPKYRGRLHDEALRG